MDTISRRALKILEGIDGRVYNKLLYTLAENGYPQNNLILLYRLTAIGYPQHKLKTLLYRLITMGYPRKKENNVVHICTSTKRTLKICYTD